MKLLIWDFDGTLAHRRGAKGWSLLLEEALDAEEPGHGQSAEAFRPYLRDGFPWHRPDVPHLELCGDADAWWDGVRPLLAYASVLEQLEPTEAWMIGDNVVADFLGAEALGIPAVLVRRPDSRATRFAATLAGVEEFLADRVAA